MHRFDVKRSKMLSYVANHSKPLNYKSDQLILNCIDLTSKRAKMMSYVAKHSKLRKTTKVINLYWIASIWRQNEQKWWVTSQNIQNYAKLRKWSNYNELHRFDVKTIYNDELRRKTFKTTQNYESDQIIMNCIDLTSNDLKCWVTSQTIQNRKTTKVINYNELHRFDVKTIKNDELRRKTFKTTQNYKVIKL